MNIQGGCEFFRGGLAREHNCKGFHYEYVMHILSSYALTHGKNFFRLENCAEKTGNIFAC